MYTMIRISTVKALALVAALLLYCGTVNAQDADTCAGGVLAPKASGVDLVVTAPCTVQAGIYKFKDVHVLAGGVLTFEDAVIDFWAANILVESDGSLVAGSPESPIGTKGGTLTIHLWGKDQTGTDPTKQGQGVVCLSDRKGHCGVPDALWDANVDAMGMPISPDLAKKISALGAVAAQYPRADDDLKEAGYVDVKDDYFYAYDPLTFDGAKDSAGRVGYFGYKVLAVSYGGTLELFGKEGATYATPECGIAPTSSGSSWARLDKPAAIGDTKLTVDRNLSLKAGDQIVVTTTDYMPGHSEQLQVASDVVCGKAIAFTNGLKYPHNGTRFSLASVPDGIGLDVQLKGQGAETRAAVGVLTRSIRIVSAGDTIGSDFPAEPTKDSRAPGYYFGGHMIARQGFKRFQVQGVELRQMGQGGKIGHYPVHFHHTRKAPADTFVRDSSINESMTRWIVLHGAQYVHLERNVGWKSIGHGFYLEDGTETDNTLTANLGVFARAAVDNDQNPRKVPGILAASNLFNQVNDDIPYTSDYDYPSVFWIMNSWNDFKDNMAVGAGTCGV
ncbi:MAG: G8 domain-containing protein, partial [Dokdonella sp.]